MQAPVLPRKLWYQGRREIITTGQEILLNESRSLIVLGEAGMGKSTLLQGLKGIDGFSVCTARRLINSPDPVALLGNATTLVIDALDEVSARLDGDAVDQVLRRLAELSLPRFILSCRVADWRKATALQGITDFYETAPLELYLNPLTREDATQYLSQVVGADTANSAIKHLAERDLGDLWRNPQTLKLIADIVAQGTLPESKAKLFAAAVNLMRSEHREEKVDTPLALLSESEVLDAAGAAFAAIILTGKEAISRGVRVADGDLPLSEVARLPNAGLLPEILGSRLFAGLPGDRFTYDHRAVGEFLGARWLARQADTQRKRRRLIELFNSLSLVPASLRGLHAWLAWHSASLAEQVITADPMGFIEYGDADNLTLSQGRDLLAALERLSETDPRFRNWSEYRAGGLIQTGLLPEIRDAIAGPHVAFGLRMLVLQALKQSPLVDQLQTELVDLLLSPKGSFAARSAAGNRLIEASIAVEWPDTFKQLLDQRTNDSVRLVNELMHEIGYHCFSDTLLLEMVRAQFDQTERTVGLFFFLERDLPDDRLDVVITEIAKMARAMGRPHERPDDDAITDLMYALLARRLNLPLPDIAELWSWLEPFEEQSGYQRETRQAVAAIFEHNDQLRRDLQRHVLLELPGDQNPWQRTWRLSKRSAGLLPSQPDVRALLDLLSDDDDRWREVVTIAQHGPEHGEVVRAVARRFATKNIEAQRWLAGLAEDTVPEWQIKQEQRQRDRQAELDASWEEHRASFAKHVEELRRGEPGVVINPAKAYLRLFRDMGDEENDGPKRLLKWLGAELRDAALDGFEAFLKLELPQPSAVDIVESHVEGQHWPTGYIILVALAERQRAGRGFDDLPDERLMAGLYELRFTSLEDHAGLTGLETRLVDELRQRGAYECALKQFFEPQLAAGLQHVDSLYALMRGEEENSLASALACDWIVRFPEMSMEAEVDLLDRLLSTDEGRSQLRAIVRERRTTDLSDERRRNWDAVGIIVDFAETLRSLGNGVGIEPELFWHLRNRLGDRRHSASSVKLKVEQLEWTIAAFRSIYPVARRPNSVTTGDTNDWDATEYLTALINRLGDIASPIATEALIRLRDAPPDGYTNVLRIAVAEQKRKRVEAEWRPPTIDTVKAAIDDKSPTTAAQLLAVLIDELAGVQAKITGSDVNWYRDFFDNGAPAAEEHCRDTIIKLFGTLPFGIQALPEGHLADAKRCDILCLLGKMMIPIEIKGQWHRELWTAADRQLDLLYTNDHRSERGIYLVLWFGPNTPKPLKAPPVGTPVPNSAQELREALVGLSASTGDGRTEIFVLDITRPT